MAKVKIPKRVAGVKIPKKVRKQAKKAIRMAENPVVREAAVAALGAVGGASAGGNGRGARRGPGRIDADTLVEAIGEAAIDGIRRFLEGFEEGLRKASAAAGDAADAVDERSDGDERSKDDEKARASRRAEAASVD